MKSIFLILSLSLVLNVTAQEITGSELLEKAIAYHDPNGNWETFSGELKLTFSGPAMSDRESVVTIDLPKQYFNVSSEQEGKATFRELKGDACHFTDKEGTIVSVSASDKQCERTVMFRNYYTYLYGLPMKLKDPGTNVDELVKRRTFKGKEYLVLRVTYDAAVGSDIWQFYFNPDTYAMEVYQFFKGTDENTGEYILLTGEHTISGVKLPKDRAWYYNKDNKYLGTDALKTK